MKPKRKTPSEQTIHARRNLREVLKEAGSFGATDWKFLAVAERADALGKRIIAAAAFLAYAEAADAKEQGGK